MRHLTHGRSRPGPRRQLAVVAIGVGLVAGCASGSPLGSREPAAPPSPAGSPVTELDRPSAAPSPAARSEPPATGQPAPSAPVGTEVGDRAPDFTLRDLKGKTISLAGLRGRPVWLMFWAPGCVSCEPTLLEADRLQAQNAARSELAVVSVAVYTFSEDAQWYASALDLSYPVALDEDGQVFTRYRAITLPAHVWIDRDGIIRDWAEGEVPPDLLAAGVERIVSSD